MSWFGELPLRWKLLGCVGLVLGLTVTLSVLAYRRVVANEASTALVNETLTVLQLTNEAESSLEQMQTGYRGFLLTGRNEFLESYDAGKASYWDRLGALQRRAAGDPAQARRWREAARQSEDWQRDIAEPGIRSRREAYVTGGDLGQLPALVPSSVGRQQIEAIQRLFDEARSAETALLELREVQFRVANAQLKQVLIWGTGATVGLGVLVAFLLARDLIRVATRLAAAAMRIADGDYRYRINLRRRDELGLTAAAFDRMAAQLAMADTERRRAEAALRAVNAELEQFAYTISHDLKAPLVTIQGFAQRLVKDYAVTLDDVGRRYLARIEVNATQLGDLIEDVLAFSRVGRIGAPPVSVDLDDALRRVLDGLQAAIEHTGATVRVDSPLPTVMASPSLIGQILTNLVANALTYGAAPGAAPLIKVGCQDLGPRWRLFVRDHGPGISREDQGRLFRLFERLAVGKAANPHGSGVGLATVRRAAQAMDGTTGVESSPGAGATFWVEFPKVPPWTAPASAALDDAGSWDKRPATTGTGWVGALKLGPSTGDGPSSVLIRPGSRGSRA